MWAIITGGSKGLGLAMAKELYSEAYSVVLVGRSKGRLEAAMKQVLRCAPKKRYVYSPRPKVLTFPCDLSSPDGVQSLHKWTSSHSIVPDVLVNNAGAYLYSDLQDLGQKKIDNILSLDIDTPVNLCRIYHDEMACDGGRHIVNIASYSVYMPIRGLSLYAGSKAFIRTFGKCLAKEFGPSGIKVTTIAPAGIDTDLMNLRPSVRNIARRLGFLAKPETVARISCRVMKIPFIHYWIPLWYNVLFIPFLMLFQWVYKRVL